MTRQQRAKQFQPFDAMKGLSEALKDREERHLRVQKRDISEEKVEEISSVLERVVVGVSVRVEYYKAFHYVVIRGIVKKIDVAHKCFLINEEKIFFSDIYDIRITDYEK